MSAPYQIEKGVPVPPPRRARIKYKQRTRPTHSRLIATLEVMAVGDSFLCPHEDSGTRSGPKHRADAWAQRCHAGQRSFVTKQDKGGVRVWRTE